MQGQKALIKNKQPIPHGDSGLAKKQKKTKRGIPDCQRGLQLWGGDEHSAPACYDMKKSCTGKGFTSSNKKLLFSSNPFQRGVYI